MRALNLWGLIRPNSLNTHKSSPAPAARPRALAKLKNERRCCKLIYQLNIYIYPNQLKVWRSSDPSEIHPQPHVVTVSLATPTLFRLGIGNDLEMS